MKTSVLAATDLKLETKDGVYFYPKGSLIQVEVNKDNDVLVVHHRLGEEEKENDKKEKIKVPKVETSHLRFLRMEDLKFFAVSTVLESQLSKAIDFKDITVTEAMFDERLTPAHISRYTNGISSVTKTFTKEGKEYIRLPVMIREKILTENEKIKIISEFEQIDTSKVKTSEILAMSARDKGNANETGYLVALERVALNDVDDHLVEYLNSKIAKAAESNWKVKKTEGSIKVYLNGQRPATLMNVLGTLPVKVHVEQGKDNDNPFFEIKSLDPKLEEVVESYYTKTTFHKDYKREDAVDGDPKEGDPCVSEGKKGTLVKQGESLVCMVKESVSLNFDEDAREGDPCSTKEGQYGVLSMVEGCLACVIQNPKVNETSGETELVDHVEWNIPKKAPSKEAEFVNNSTGDGASPKVGDPCNYGGKSGTLALLNGALICQIGGDKPAGSDGAN